MPGCGELLKSKTKKMMSSFPWKAKWDGIPSREEAKVKAKKAVLSVGECDERSLPYSPGRSNIMILLSIAWLCMKRRKQDFYIYIYISMRRMQQYQSFHIHTPCSRSKTTGSKPQRNSRNTPADEEESLGSKRPKIG